MATIDIDHPDAEELIDAKTNTDQLNGVNISVKIEDSFMDRLDEILLENKGSIVGGGRMEDIEDEIIENFQMTASVKGPVTKRDRNAILDKIANNQAKYAEPGILFWSRIKEQSDSIIYGKEGMRPVSTNPC